MSLTYVVDTDCYLIYPLAAWSKLQDRGEPDSCITGYYIDYRHPAPVRCGVERQTPVFLEPIPARGYYSPGEVDRRQLTVAGKGQVLGAEPGYSFSLNGI